MIMRACLKPEGRYAYIAPYYAQAKLVAWDYLKKYSESVRVGKPNESELRVDLFNGARCRLLGADNADSLRGIGLDGVVLDEYSQCRPSVFGEIIRPALADRQGWCTFIGTPKGRVGLYDIYHGHEPWDGDGFYRLLLKQSETHILPQSEVDDLKKRLTEDQFAQEMECSFDAAIRGAVYGKYMATVRAEKRITRVPYDPSLLVYTGWDLGRHDPTAIWFSQTKGRETRLIDYYESSGIDVAHYAGVLKQRDYNYGGHILPHDGAKKEFTSDKSAQDVLASLGVKPLIILTQHRPEDGINAARLLMPMCVFDEERCKRGIECLEQYHYEFDEKLMTLKANPVHDWASHGADAFRYLAEGLARGVGVSKFNRKINYPELGIV